MLLSTYAGKEPIFDLAKVESTYPDGNRSSITSNGRPSTRWFRNLLMTMGI
jgi:hypothetical protein